MLEKNCNVTVSDFAVYPRTINANSSSSKKNITGELKDLLKLISAYDFWVNDNILKMTIKRIKHNNRRLNTRKINYCILSAPDYKD